MSKVVSNYTNNTEKTIYFCETDAVGVVYFGNIGKYIEIGFSEWFREFAIPLKKINKDYGIFFVVRESNQSFKKSIYYDDRIKIKTNLEKISYYYLIFSTSIYVDNEIRFLARTTLVPVDMNTKSIVKIPSELIKFMDEVQK